MKVASKLVSLGRKALYYGQIARSDRGKRDDEYIKWLGYSIPGWCGPGNVVLMNKALDLLPTADPMVEIGVFSGLSTNILAHLRRRRGLPNRHISCDAWQFENTDMHKRVGDHPSLSMEDLSGFVRESFIRNTRYFSSDVLPIHIPALSDDFFELWHDAVETRDVFGQDVELGGPISLAFVDGDHRYEAVLRDFENIDRHLVRGGLILFDDSADFSDWGPNRLSKELLASGRYELVQKNPNYLIRKR